MDGMFDRNHDGKLSMEERMERDYFITEIMNQSSSGTHIYRQGRSGSGQAGMRLLGLFALMIGVNALIYFPGFSLIMLALSVVLFIS